jgi:hypothetical protein
MPHPEQRRTVTTFRQQRHCLGCADGGEVGDGGSSSSSLSESISTFILMKSVISQTVLEQLGQTHTRTCVCVTVYAHTLHKPQGQRRPGLSTPVAAAGFWRGRQVSHGQSGGPFHVCRLSRRHRCRSAPKLINRVSSSFYDSPGPSTRYANSSHRRDKHDGASNHESGSDSKHWHCRPHAARRPTPKVLACDARVGESVSLYVRVRTQSHSPYKPTRVPEVMILR